MASKLFGYKKRLVDNYLEKLNEENKAKISDVKNKINEYKRQNEELHQKLNNFGIEKSVSLKDSDFLDAARKRAEKIKQLIKESADVEINQILLSSNLKLCVYDEKITELKKEIDNVKNHLSVLLRNVEESLAYDFGARFDSTKYDQEKVLNSISNVPEHLPVNKDRNVIDIGASRDRDGRLGRIEKSAYISNDVEKYPSSISVTNQVEELVRKTGTEDMYGSSSNSIEPKRSNFWESESSKKNNDNYVPETRTSKSMDDILVSNDTRSYESAIRETRSYESMLNDTRSYESSMNEARTYANSMNEVRSQEKAINDARPYEKAYTDGLSFPTQPLMSEELKNINLRDNNVGTLANDLLKMKSENRNDVVSREINDIKYKYIVGKIAGEDLFDNGGNLIIRKNDLISNEVVERADREKKLSELIIDMILPNLS